MDMITLGADIIISKLLKKSAREALDNASYSSSISKPEYSDLLWALDRLAGAKTGNLLELDNISKNLDSVRLTKLEAADWVKAINKLGGRVRYHVDNSKISAYFSKNNVGAAFDGLSIPPTIWIRKGDASDLEMFHESMYFEDYIRRGRENYLRGGAESLVPLTFGKKTIIPERDMLISKYIKEKYVLDKILEEQEAWTEKFGSGIDNFLSELIHEGTHTLDNLEIQKLLDDGASDLQINKQFGNNRSFEKRAFFHERAFQLAIGIPPDFNTIEEMLKHIFRYYGEN